MPLFATCMFARVNYLDVLLREGGLIAAWFSALHLSVFVVNLHMLWDQLVHGEKQAGRL